MIKMKKVFALPLSFCLAFMLCTVPANAISQDIGGSSKSEYTTRASYSVTDLPDGGKDYVFLVEGVENHYLVPPEGFNPVVASDEQLATYAFPPRPDVEDFDAYSQWVSLMENYESTPLPEIEITVKPVEDENVSSTQTRSVTGTMRTTNWAGYVADLGTNSSNFYTQVQMDYKHPTIADIGGTSVTSYWVGLGGSNTHKLVQAGTATHNTAIHYAWYEYLSDTGETVAAQHLESLTINPGDRMHVYISFQRANNKFSYYIANNTTGKSASGIVNLSAATQFDGSTAEWIIERAEIPTTSGGTYLTSLGNFGEISITNCQATKNTSNTWYNLGQLNVKKCVMYNNSGSYILAEPGSITSSNRFICYFRNYH